MDDSPLPQYNRKTTLRVKLTDKAANVGITTGGLGVILAVLGLIAFIFWQVLPLFQQGEIGQVRDAIEQPSDRPLLIHTDEYRRVGVRLDETGAVRAFSLPTGEVIKDQSLGELLEAAGLPGLNGAVITDVDISLRPRTSKKIGRTLDVPHYHLLVGTSDGRVIVATIAYVTGYLRFTEEEEPEDLLRLAMPTEEDFKDPTYVPDSVVRDGKFVEHLQDFGFYRTVEAIVEVDHEMGIDTGGAPVRLVDGTINVASAEDDRRALTLVVTGDGRTVLVEEESEVNMFTDEVEWSTKNTDLTDRLTIVPDFVMVNGLMDRLVLSDRSGDTHVFEYDSRREVFAEDYPAFNVFGAQADVPAGRHWREIVNEQRTGAGHDAMDTPLQLTVVQYLLGDQTVIFGDNRGGLQAWFPVPDEDEGRPKRFTRVRTHTPAAGEVVNIAPVPVQKAMLVMDRNGDARMINNTAERTYAEVKAPGGRIGYIPPKADGLLIVTDDGHVHHWWLKAPHAEASMKTLFGSVWYEDFQEPGYEWQTSSGTDDVEPKFNLIPLISGTLKGALYALLFSIPMAVLAAIYTSEFMHRNLRSIFKPAMEVMASLPSVVLGFLAALYFAPKAAPMMPTVLTALFVIPGVFMVFGWLWQRFPPSFVGKFGKLSSTFLLFALLFLGIWISSVIGPRAEIMLFPAVEGANPAVIDPVTFEPLGDKAAANLDAGDFRSWTDGGQVLPRETVVEGRVLPRGWWIPGGHNLLVVILAVPLALLCGFGLRKGGGLLPRDGKGFTHLGRLREKLEGPYKGGLRAVVVDAVFSFWFLAGAIGLGLLLSVLLTPAVEWAFFSYDHPTAGTVHDFRRWVTGPEGWKFEQANSLIVGFAMGFAVIPIIYTISEDALSSVPNQLRAASLACGASRWQTTMNVVMPAAVSGIFSGIVIGLGRALGETMIVVMAAGGTPVTDMQPLSGFRSLSAAIAIEMPEAPHGGTLYRTLFLAGFVLFCMTFVINTLAEGVRIRLRRKLSRL